MRRTLSTVTALALAGSLIIIGSGPAAGEPDTRYRTCRQLWTVDPNGVAANPRAVRAAIRQGYRKPLLCPVAYAANRRLDRDRDGVACERRP
ncbi:MAG: hypothetical protein GC156_08710 [Actinomycetales bacterium]|nr:hypothetical protein [Actinomycetales bacterium]